MRHIFATGECILDIAFNDGHIVFAGPGGSKLNTAVSLGRLGLQISMVSECTDDPVGELIVSFLRQNGISTDHIAGYPGQVRIAFAFLDQDNNASYTFYSGKRQEEPTHRVPAFSAEDVFLFGSFYSLKQENRNHIRQLTDAASNAGCILIYDPNFRKPHLNVLEQVRPFILENIRSADIVRGSDEDFRNIFQLDDPEQIFSQVLAAGGKSLILTQGHRDVWLFASRIRKPYKVPPIKTVSSIGAGDGFNAGIIYELIRRGILLKDLHLLDEKTWDGIIQTAMTFASHVCSESDNYISLSFARKINSLSPITTNNHK